MLGIRQKLIGRLEGHKLLKTAKELLQKKYNLIDMDQFVLGDRQPNELQNATVKKVPTILYSEENIEFLQERDIKVFTELVQLNKNICVLAHGVNKNFPFEFINHFDFWIQLRQLNSKAEPITHDMTKPKDFLFLSRRETELRGLLRDKLTATGCLNNSIISYDRGARGIKHLEKQYEHVSFFDTNFKSVNCHYKPAIWQVIPQQFANTKYSIVAETIETNHVHCMSEKIFKPIIAGHIFIALAGSGYLNYLRQYGFKTFHDYIDESYDMETDPIKRVEKIVLSCQDLTSRNHIELYKQVAHITKHNRELFFDGQHLQNLNIDIIQEVKEHLKT